MMLRWLLSLIFVAQMYLVLIALMLVFTPVALLWRGASFFWMQTFCRWTRISARILVGLHSEVRGTIPAGAVLIASKHQSFFDSIILFSVLDAPRFIMKKQLAYVPLAGWHALRIGCIPVDRGKRGAAIKQMVEAVASGAQRPGQLIIYPQGTRIAPGVAAPYKVGTAALYAQLGQVCVPVGTNVGLFWPRRGILRKPGLAVVEFLPPIAPGLDTPAFMAELEARIEASSKALMAEAGFRGA
jgi:1-acyl-sn-glycerol-3-phosphate acyltransferase